MVSLKPSDELLERRVILELQPVPKGPLSVFEFVLCSSNGLRETEERQSKVDKAILEVLKLVLAINDLWSLSS